MTSKVKHYFYSYGFLQYKYWRTKKGQAHREDGPACEYADGIRYWYKNGKRHREDGPAIVWENGRHEYFLNGIEFFKEEYWKEIEKIKKRKKNK